MVLSVYDCSRQGVVTSIVLSVYDPWYCLSMTVAVNTGGSYIHGTVCL